MERASPLSTSPCRHPRLTSRHRACRDVASARTVDRQFESCCGSVRTSRRPSPLSLLSGISTATHYIHTYYILISGRLTLHWCQKWDFLEFSALPAWIRKHLQRSKSGNRDLFCHCNEPDSGTPMVQCDNCLEWYHVASVGLTMSAARRLSIFICKDCGP